MQLKNNSIKIMVYNIEGCNWKNYPIKRNSIKYREMQLKR
jgi:hypothetical protein